MRGIESYMQPVDVLIVERKSIRTTVAAPLIKIWRMRLQSTSTVGW